MELLIIAAVLYFVPAAIAAVRRHHNANAIFLLDLFLGWTFVGWVIALVWSVTAVQPRPGAASLYARPSAQDVRFSLWWLAVGLGIPLLGIVTAFLAK